MNDFKNFTGNIPKDALSKDETESIQKIASSLEGKSEKDIWTRIRKEAEARRRAGTLSDAEIDQFVKKVSPMLNSSQKKKLSSMAEKLKKS